ncbi:MAG: hypothetical protein Q4P15_11205 [Propionibacteriaceae bacterium]|nr:hypothetical protein [Propionibacteriaceae bacterium]
MSEERPPDIRAIDDPSRQTYRYVRAAIIGSVLLLFVSVTIQIIADGGAILSSISAYYYGPVRGVFVGVLVATGLALVAVKGRPGVEEISLNLAGMLAPVVAFVPTPLPAVDGSCRVGAQRCIAAEFLPGVENNMAALILIGAPLLVLAWWTAIRIIDFNRSVRLSLSGATAVWIGFAIWFFFGPRGAFLEAAHYVAAGLMFTLIVVVVGYNALRTDHALTVGETSVPCRHIYRVIGVLMALSLVSALVFHWVTRAALDRPFPLLFVLEAILLLLFMAFWIVQTWEFWNAGLPAEAKGQ